MHLGIEPRDVIQRLRDQLPPHWELGFAADAAEAEATNRLRPCSAFLVPGDEDARDLSDSGIVMQSVSQQVVVLICARNYRLTDRGEQLDALKPCKIAVRQALIGWHAPGMTGPLVLGRSSLLRYTAELVVWVEQFRSTYQIEVH